MAEPKHSVDLLSEKVLQTSFADFPSSTVSKTKLHVLDTLGVALAGASSIETRTVIDSLNLAADTGHSTAWGLPHRVNPRTASFINGISAHAFELDDSGGCDHSGAVVLPAALAILPNITHPVSGTDLIRSVVMGYEVGRRVLEATGGYEKHNAIGWHSTGTCGVFGAATSVGLLLGLDSSQLASALGIACSYAGGTWGFIHDGSQTKKLHPGRAAEGGVCAALLAAGNFKGPSAVFDVGAWGGFFSSFTPEYADENCLHADFGDNWRLNRCSIKPYATCRGTHSAIDAVNILLSMHNLGPESIEHLEVAMSPFQFGMCGSKAVSTRAEAQMSLPYAIAAKLHFGKVGLTELEPASYLAPEIQRWLGLISVHSDSTMQDEDEPSVSVISKRQRHYTIVVPCPLGSPDNPLTEQQLISKFVDLSSGTLPQSALQRLQQSILSLETIGDVRTLPDLLSAF